jgi:hypothetical protein
MRRIILTVLILAAAVYFFLVAAVNDDIKWFRNFSKSSNKQVRQSFQSFDFSYNDVFSTCFSIKFTQSDTVFIKQHFAPAFSDTPKSGQSYYAILTDKEKQRLDSFISKINFSKLDTSYFEPYQDGVEYQFYIDKDTTKKLIYVHSDSIPTNVKAFVSWLVILKKKMKLHPVDTTFSFESVRHFIPPKVPEPKMKLTPPKIE